MQIAEKLNVNTTTLKIIALVTMIIDHIGAILFPQIRILRYIGRFAFPIYAYLIGEGCKYTRDKLGYLQKVIGTFIVFQIISYPISDYEVEVCVLFGFACAIATTIIIDWAKKDIIKRRPLAAIPIMCLFASTTLLKSDYMFFAMILPLIVCYVNKKIIKNLLFAIGLVLCSVVYGASQWFAIFAMIPLILYNGKKGKIFLFKNSFYILYPLHYAVIGLVKLFLP